MRVTSFFAAAALAGSVAAFAAPAAAAVVVQNFYEGGLLQVGFTGSETGVAVTGDLPPYNQEVTFSSSSPLQTLDAGGNVIVWGLQSGSGTFSDISYGFTNPDLYFTSTNFTVSFLNTTQFPARGTLTAILADNSVVTLFTDRVLLNNNTFNVSSTAGEGIKQISLSFTTPSGAPRGAVKLDSVELAAAVPEPTTWALMIMGFGGAGAMLRSRRRALAA